MDIIDRCNAQKPTTSTSAKTELERFLQLETATQDCVAEYNCLSFSSFIMCDDTN